MGKREMDVRTGGHNIPHYANVERVSEAGYPVQPFVERQTIFHMPPEPTQQARLQEFRDRGVSNPQIPYDVSVPIFDGAAEAASYNRFFSDPGRREGQWLTTETSPERLARPPSAATSLARASVEQGAAVRLSRAASNDWGQGGGTQVEMRGEDWNNRVKFMDE